MNNWQFWNRRLPRPKRTEPFTWNYNFNFPPQLMIGVNTGSWSPGVIRLIAVDTNTAGTISGGPVKNVARSAPSVFSLNSDLNKEADIDNLLKRQTIFQSLLKEYLKKSTGQKRWKIFPSRKWNIRNTRMCCKVYWGCLWQPTEIRCWITRKQRGFTPSSWF